MSSYKDRKKLAEFEKLESKFEMEYQMRVGILAGIVSGLLVIIIMNSYNIILKYTGNTFIAFFIGFFIAILLIYFFIERPLNGIRREIKDFKNKYLHKKSGLIT